jgi:hypothetical protein
MKFGNLGRGNCLKSATALETYILLSKYFVMDLHTKSYVFTCILHVNMHLKKDIQKCNNCGFVST